MKTLFLPRSNKNWIGHAFESLFYGLNSCSRSVLFASLIHEVLANSKVYRVYPRVFSIVVSTLKG